MSRQSQNAVYIKDRPFTHLKQGFLLIVNFFNNSNSVNFMLS